MPSMYANVLVICEYRYCQWYLLPESTDGLGVPVLCVAAKLDDVVLVAVLSGWLDMAHVSNRYAHLYRLLHQLL